MKILLVGGTGNISWWCADEALRHGCDVTILTRGETLATRRRAQDEVRQIRLDVNDLQGLARWVGDEHFDVVSDFIAYSADEFRKRWFVLENAFDRYIFVSSTLVFERNSDTGRLNEASLRRPFGVSDYIDGKIGIEDFITGDTKRFDRSLIVRPAHTFDTNVPTPLGSNCFTDVQGLLHGKPLLIPGDGSGLWTIMHSSDFARAWMALILENNSYGNFVNVVGDEVMTWNDMADSILRALNLPSGQVKHIPIEKIEALQIFDRQTANSSSLGRNFRLHRKWDDLYDTSELRRLIPGWECHTSFREGFMSTIDWLRGDPARIRTNPHLRLALNELADSLSTD
jgi:nucleoside-diphosphate-sugar epimerase